MYSRKVIPVTNAKTVKETAVGIEKKDKKKKKTLENI